MSNNVTSLARYQIVPTRQMNFKIKYRANAKATFTDWGNGVVFDTVDAAKSFIEAHKKLSAKQQQFILDNPPVEVF